MEMHDETVAMVGDLLGAENAAGNITTGGTESNLCAVLSAKSRALATGKSQPGRNGSMVLPRTAHYSFFKAGHLFDIEPIVVDPVPGTFHRVDPEAVRRAVREDTILVVATAGVWPFGSVDPIAEIGEIAIEKDIYLHVDGCFGGFILPFLERDGYDVEIPAWDFRVKGVCSVSADFHKNGMVPPPASCIVFRNEELLGFARKLAPPNGCITGTRATGPMVAAWTMLNLVGLEGYIAISRKSMEMKKALEEGVRQIAGLEFLPGSKINMTVVYSQEYDLMPVITELRRHGWSFAVQPTPPPISLQIITMPQNDGQIDPFLDELKRAMKLAQPIKSAADIKQYGEEYPTVF
jgi:glutamate/tyrosine decarboxylase-like PLP-dependent enzyme